MPRKRRKNPDLLVWDCDPGCDDALAIAWMLQPDICPYFDVDFLTVTGNVHVEQTTSNTRRVVTACLSGRGEDQKPRTCRIFRGMSRSLTGDEPSASSVHGRDGLGGVPNNLSGCGMEKLHELEKAAAAERYLEIARTKGIKFDLLCTGPLTNLAAALSCMNRQEMVSFWTGCRRVVFMGGNFLSQGNITQSAEFNFHADPIAAQMVLTFYREVNRLPQKKRLPDLEFVPLDITETVGIKVDGKVGTPATPAGGLLRYALKEYGMFHSLSASRPRNVARFDAKQHVKAQLAGGGGIGELVRFCHLHDPVAAWVIARQPEGLGWQTSDVRIDTNSGDSRGRIINCSPKNGLPFPHAGRGARVRWLTGEKKNRTAIIKNLIPKLKRLMGFN